LAALAGAAVLLLAGLLCLPRVDPRLVVVMLAAGAGLLVAGLRLGVSDSGPVPALAEQRAVVEADLRVTSDPRLVTGAFGDLVVLSARLEEVTARGISTRIRSPVTVFADTGWEDVALGSSIRVVGRLQESDDPSIGCRARARTGSSVCSGSRLVVGRLVGAAQRCGRGGGDGRQPRARAGAGPRRR
jgi:competence protein ComEC